MSQTTILVVDPDASISIRDDGNHYLSPWFSPKVSQSARLKRQQALRCGKPDSILGVAKQRSYHSRGYSGRSTHSAIYGWTDSAGSVMGIRRILCQGTLLLAHARQKRIGINRDRAVLPSICTVESTEPNAAI